MSVISGDLWSKDFTKISKGMVFVYTKISKQSSFVMSEVATGHYLQRDMYIIINIHTKSTLNPLPLKIILGQKTHTKSRWSNI